MKSSYLIVDDEPLARKLIASHASKIEGLEIAGECTNALEASNFIRKKRVDLIFLDIQMPELSGIDFLKTLTNPPSIIITTAHRDFALDAFDLDVIDYLLKPVSFERLLKATNKFFDRQITGHNMAELSITPDHFIYLKVDRKTHKLSLEEILYIESLDDYVKVYFKDRSIITRENISSLEKRLPENQFVRIHRSFIVSISHVKIVSADGIGIAGKELPFGRVYKQKALMHFGL
ncbi:MAG: response regulator transcription factor [Cyclobacteriaceae bacterium]|nr:response regulator transcription factor [Cyclobacteriaceae bacterium]